MYNIGISRFTDAKIIAIETHDFFHNPHYEKINTHRCDHEVVPTKGTGKISCYR